ncbi:hypothetical protein RB213_001031 [Colletotrichum asianum]
MSTSNDPEPALSSFELFPKLPNCLKFMIWEDFYLEPRYFLVDGSGNSRVDDTVEWVMKPRPRKKKYYTAIDTELDPLASNVARTIRPELTIEASKGSAKAEHVKINWRLDFVHLRWRDGVHQCKALPDFEWVAKVQNLVLDDTIADVSEFDTSTEEIHRIAMLLWHRQSPIDARRAGGTASAAKDGKACKTNLNQILNSGTCVNGKCQIIIPPNETSNVRSADCE